jgi:hypothetical protein
LLLEAPGTHLRGVRFRPAAVAAPSGVVLPERFIPADSVLGSRQARRLADREGIDDWIDAIEPNQRASAAVD